MLVLGTLNLVFVSILGVLVEVGLALAVDADLKYLAGVRVGTAGSDSILDGLERLVNGCEGIEVGALDTWLEGGLTLLGGGDRLLDALDELNEAFCHIYLTVTFIAIYDQIELSKLDSRPEYPATIKDINEQLSPPSGELFFEYILVDPLECVNLLIAAGSR